MSVLESRRMSVGVLACCFLAGLGFLVACGGPAEKPAETPSEAPAATPAEEAAPAPQAPAEMPAEEAAPAPEEAPAPEAAAGTITLGDAAKGKSIYETYCVACHGAEGKGDGAAAATLTTKPADHSDGNIMNAIPNEVLFKAIKEGGAAVGKSNLMPAWGATLKDEQISDVLAYVRSLANPPYEGPK
jgi:cytochrome c oxidase cbb3-type subunit 3